MAEPSRDNSVVRHEVRRLLERSPAFLALPPNARRDLANHMVRVGSYLADPGWIEPSSPIRAAALADSDPVNDIKARLAAKPGQIGAEFKADAVHQGIEEFGHLVKTVDFPAFVSGLVQGVFKAVVDASIEQMRAYAELLAAAVKTVDEFARDHISDGEARDHIAQRYPQAVVVDTSGEGLARLRPAPNSDESGVDLGKAYNIGRYVNLEDEASEAALVAAAKLELARSRQQLMATTMILGINRIIITDGKINAKVVFDIRAEDSAARRAKASMHDETRSATEVKAAAAVWSPWGAGGTSTSRSTSHVATVSSAIDDTSQSKAEAKAQLSGDVKLSFRSETFPLERMVDPVGLALLNARAQPAPTANAAAPAPASASPPAVPGR